MPLFALPLVAVDTETTGLDPVSARLVEVAAIRASGGNLEPEPPLVARVNPGVPIPAASTAIHHISDEMIAGAPSAGQVLPRLQTQIAGRLLVGHAVGFDLAVLANEARRSGIGWRKPRSLCVRTLAMIAMPDLASHSLDGLAQWLGIEIVNRHSALGDAEAAAHIFIALMPHLERKGIRTLAEAERACRQHDSNRPSRAAPGWVSPVGESSPALGTLSAHDTFAYRHVVEDLMTRDPAILSDHEPLEQAVRVMVERNISSVLIAKAAAPAQPISAYGILTERDVLRRLAEAGPAVLQQPTGRFASRPLHAIRGKAFVYRAIGRLRRLGVRHLAVRDERNRLEGIITARDLLRTQGSAAIALDDAIQVAETPRTLAVAWSGLPAVAAALVEEGVEARTVSRVVSEEIRAMTRRAAILAERSLVEAGRGAAPAPFAVLVLGSGGRGESLLAPDQDNALVFEATGEAAGPGGAHDRWFEELGARMSEFLDEAGIPLCRGGVMARNARWRGSLATWYARIGDWVAQSRPEDLLNVDIFFDMIAVHGDVDLGQRLLAHAYDAGSRNRPFAKLLGESLTTGDPFNLFGGLRVEDGRIDLKRHGLFPIVGFARTLCVRNGLMAGSTGERLTALAGVLGAAHELERFARDHATFVAALLKQQAFDIEAGHKPGNKVDPKLLGSEALEQVRASLRHVRLIPELLRDLMFASPASAGTASPEDGR
jgi:DNA polymerase-3 subunit epsilon/CBS domain-containing protein